MATYFENYHGWLQDIRAMENQTGPVPENGDDSLHPYPALKTHLKDGFHKSGFSTRRTVTEEEMQP